MSINGMNFEQFKAQFTGKPIYIRMHTGQRTDGKFSSNFASGLTEDSPDLMVPWEYEQLLSIQDFPHAWYFSENMLSRRKAGKLKFICEKCASSDHENCVGLPNGDRTWCDCQHAGTIVARKP